MTPDLKNPRVVDAISTALACLLGTITGLTLLWLSAGPADPTIWGFPLEIIGHGLLLATGIHIGAGVYRWFRH